MDVCGGDIDLRLDERALAERLGISRTPIREAFARLAQEGFVEIRARRGVFVRPRTLEEVLGMVICWAALESMAARLATELASEQEIGSLRELGAVPGGARQAPRHRRVLERQHPLPPAHPRALPVRAARRRRRGAAAAPVRPAPPRHGRERSGAPSGADHAAIVESIERREGDRAAALVREHAMRLHDHIHATWPERDGAVRAGPGGYRHPPP